MNLKVYAKDKQEKGSVKLPPQFSEPVRSDLIAKAAHAIQSNNRQPYGTDPFAGKRKSTAVSKRRRNYRGSYGHGISRVPRKVMSRSGTHMNWQGALSPNTVGGREAHPPKSWKNWKKKINQKENQKAIRSGLAATVDKTLVVMHGHKVPDIYPFALDDSIEQIAKTKDVYAAFVTLGMEDELSRSSEKTIRAGHGKMRNRPYRKKKGPLVVVSAKCPLMKAASGLPGVTVVLYNQINVLHLAPGLQAGRMTLFTKSALDKIGTEKVYAQ